MVYELRSSCHPHRHHAHITMSTDDHVTDLAINLLANALH